MQAFRLINVILINAPTVAVSVYYCGVMVSLYYATQWTMFITALYFLIVWHAANKAFECEQLQEDSEDHLYFKITFCELDDVN